MITNYKYTFGLKKRKKYQRKAKTNAQCVITGEHVNSTGVLFTYL
jgi:ribosomal protein L34E